MDVDPCRGALANSDDEARLCQIKLGVSSVHRWSTEIQTLKACFKKIWLCEGESEPSSFEFAYALDWAMNLDRLSVDTYGVHHGVKEPKKLREQLGKRTPKS